MLLQAHRTMGWLGDSSAVMVDMHGAGVAFGDVLDIKAYRPASTSVSSGQVLHCPYTNEQARLIVWEMADQMILDLVAKKLMTSQIVLDVGYDIKSYASSGSPYHGLAWGLFCRNGRYARGRCSLWRCS